MSADGIQSSLQVRQATPKELAAIEAKVASPGGEWQLASATLMYTKAGRRFGEPVMSPQYRLQKGLGMWSLIFAGNPAGLIDSRAMQLVNYLLKHPTENALHASVLENLIDGSPLLDGFSGIGGDTDSDGLPQFQVGEVGGVIQEGTGKKFTGQISLPAFKAELKEYREASKDQTIPKIEREEAERKLKALLRAYARGGKMADASGRAVDRVRKQIKTHIKNLLVAESSLGQANRVLRAFGKHLEDYLWLPSVGAKKRKGASGKAGCFIYEPPAGVVWEN